jgi:acyl-homoserine lactone acylase PvdQ
MFRPVDQAVQRRRRLFDVEVFCGTIRTMKKLVLVAAASDRLATDFGSWKTPWGDINRYQRVNGAIVQPFDDAKPSIPVGFTSARWGSLASFGARTYKGTKRCTARAATALSPPSNSATACARER